MPEGIHISPGIVWLIVAILLLIVEVFTGTFFILWVAIAALIAGLFAFWTAQWLAWLIFVISSAVLLVITRPLAHKLHHHLPARTNVDALIGQTAFVIETVDPLANTGRVRVGSDEWRARCDRVVEAGSQVIVLGVTGATLVVKPAEKTAEATE
ncbi:MAG: NfeD family protein [Armatimonadetes bacterium]|nr:NfeD family protein [Armatimonadota bacterium]